MITTLLSALIMCHVYLEADGFQKHQLEGLSKFRMDNQIEAKIACARAVAKGIDTAEVCKPVPEYQNNLMKMPRVKMLEMWSAQEYRFKTTGNTWEKATIGERDVPLMGMKVSVNDYLPVMALLLTTFAVGAWLSLRSVAAALAEIRLSSRDDVVRAARLYFTFTVPLDGNKDDRVVRWIARLAFWLPTIALILGIVLDFLPVIKVMGGMQAWVGTLRDLASREVVLVVCTLVCFSVAYTHSELRDRIDGLTAPRQPQAVKSGQSTSTPSPP